MPSPYGSGIPTRRLASGKVASILQHVLPSD